jgi:spermidine synthase
MNRSRTNIIYLLFFTTGLSSLIYQVLWVRMFGLVFGNTLYASSAVLAAFMGGLALGSSLSGSLLEKRQDGLRVYSALEIGVGLCGVLMASGIALVSRFDLLVYRSSAPSYELLTALRFLYSLVLLVVPCTFMGATLPLLAASVTKGRIDHGNIVGRLYAANTLGAFAGCFISGFFLIGTLGISRTTLLTACVNLVVAAVAFGLFRGDERRTATDAPAGVPAEPRGVAETKPGGRGTVVLVAYACCGFAALSLEVAWTRSLVWIMGMDSYAFAAMLCVILAGIGLGSLLFPWVDARIRRPVVVLAWVQLLAGASVIGSILVIHHAVAVREAITAAMNLPVVRGMYGVLAPYTVIQLLVSAAILFVPSLLMGLAFPLFAKVYIGMRGSVAKGTGAIYSVNTLGGIFGSIAMGFVVIPLIGLLPAIALMGAVYFASAIALTIAAGTEPVPVKLGKAVFAAAALVLLWANMDMRFVSVLETTLGADPSRRDESILSFKETPTGSVLVKQSSLYGKEMLIDGVQVASTGDFDLHSHIYPAHLIGLMKKDLDDVLVIAFGAGGTSGSLLKYPEVKRLDVVEICEGVIEPARRLFSEMNSNVFSDPRLHLIIQDGKNYVRMTDRKYDVIYSGPIHPQSNQGSAALYTRDYFADCRARLKQGGFQCLWLPLHMSSPQDFYAIVKAYMAVYPFVTLWQMPETETSESHPHLLGSMTPILPDYGLIAERLSRPIIRADIARLRDAGFTQPSEFVSQLAMDRAGLEKMLEGFTRVNTDDVPSVEFYQRPLNVQLASKITQISLYRQIETLMQNPTGLVQNVPETDKNAFSVQVARLFAGNRALIKGHAYYIARLNLQPDAEMLSNFNYLIIQFYSQAFRAIPESTYLRKFFEENHITPAAD